jgi:integrase/recombinase XerC
MNAARLIKHFLADKGTLTALAYKRDLHDFRLQLRTPSAELAVEKLFGGSHPSAQRILGSYLAAMKRRGLSSSTINRRLSMLRSLGKRARVLGLIPWMLDAHNVKSEKVRDSKGPGLGNVVKMFRFLKALPADKPVLRDIAILRLCYDLALRRNEVCGVDVADIVPSGLRVRRKGKTSKQALELPDATRAALLDWLNVRGPHGGPLFINFDQIHRTKTGKRLSGAAIYEIIRSRAQQAGVTVPVRPHGIRHTSITEARIVAAARGHGLDRLIDFSGHSDVKTLKHYLDGEESIQGVIAADIALSD